jgi:hypothetical protein
MVINLAQAAAPEITALSPSQNSAAGTVMSSAWSNRPDPKGVEPRKKAHCTWRRGASVSSRCKVRADVVLASAPCGQ